MAIFACGSCGYEAHFVEFKVESEGSPEIDFDDDDDSPDEVQCPECGSQSCYET